jgi:DNA primase
MGTALTEDQLGALWRLHAEPTLSFDGDGAGQRAAHRAIDAALPLIQPGRSLRFALLPGGQDPTTSCATRGPSRSAPRCPPPGRWSTCCSSASAPPPTRWTRPSAAPG